MAQSRLDLQALLVDILGSSNVYFQPPSSLQMNFPCIVYQRSNIRVKFGDNLPYMRRKQYQLTVIDVNPDSITPDKISKLPQCVFDRHFVSDNFNHDIFNLLF